VLAAGVLTRFVVAATTRGLRFDLDSLRLVDLVLRTHPLHVYRFANAGGLYRWPYPPGYFPWVLAAGELSRATGLAFYAVVRSPAILADAGLAWLVQLGLGWRGEPERVRILGAALVMGGPVFFIISGYQVQIDAAAILPAVAALLLWCRPGSRPGWRRSLGAGGLIGLGAAIKTAPLVMVLALLPSAEDWRERLALVCSALAIPALALVPFAIADPHGVSHLLGYHGGPGAGGLSLAVQPDLAHFWISSLWQSRVTPLMPSGVSRALLHHGALATEIGLLALGGLAIWRRLEPLAAAVALWLGFYAFGTGFFFQYLIWGLPFFLLVGALRAVAVLQLAMLVPMVLFYFGPHGSTGSEIAFAGSLLLIWIALVVALVRALAPLIRRPAAEAAMPSPRRARRARR
jgi:hypothetical protein